MMQLSLLDVMMPPPPPTYPAIYEPPEQREVMTRAYGDEYLIHIGVDEPDPVEIEVRGTPTLVCFSHGFCTYTVQPPGSLYWSESGFRSFAGFQVIDSPRLTIDEVGVLIEVFLDRELKGKLVKWWPRYCLQWRFNRWFEQRNERATTWAQWGTEKHAEHWANFDARQSGAVARMKESGIDPDEVWRTRK